MTLRDGSLYETRCHTCGLPIGYSSYESTTTMWCNEACANTPAIRQRARQNQGRYEMTVALYMEGRTPTQIGHALGLTRQHVQAILTGRGLNPFGYMAPRHEVAS